MSEPKGSDRLRFVSVIVWVLVSVGAVGCSLGILHTVRNSTLGVSVAVTAIAGLVAIGGPIAVLITGMRKRRISMIVGALLLAPIFATYTLTSDWFKLRRLSQAAANLDARTFASPSQHHNLIVMDHSRDIDCDAICQKILLLTDYNVVVRSSTQVLYRKISDTECKATDATRRNIRFSGICVTLHVVSVVNYGLIVEATPALSDEDRAIDFLYAQLPPVFSGRVFSLMERTEGNDDRLWAAGLRARSRSGRTSRTRSARVSPAPSSMPRRCISPSANKPQPT